MMQRRSNRVLALALLLGLAGAAAAEPEVVTFQTEDRLTITGDLWSSGKKGAPAVVALHMYPSDRTSWQPIASLFETAGIDFLAIDMRGYGDSAKQGRKDLSESVKSRDSRLFRVMWRDALAAYAFLVERGADPDRVVFLGASVGCSVAIDAAAREPRIRGAVVLTPGKGYLGVETMKHLKGYGSRPILILSSEEEAGNGADAIAKALGEMAELTLLDQTGIHGTRMFGQVPKIESRIVQWVADLLSAGILLDGTVTQEEAAGGSFGEWDMMEDGVAKVTLRTAGRAIYAALRITPAATSSDRFVLAWAPRGKAEGAHRIVHQFGKRGRASLEALVSGRWKEVKGALPKDYRLGVGTGDTVEVLVPRTLPGLRQDGNLKVAFGFARRPKVAIAVLPPMDQAMTKIETWLEFGL